MSTIDRAAGPPPRTPTGLDRPEASKKVPLPDERDAELMSILSIVYEKLDDSVRHRQAIVTSTDEALSLLRVIMRDRSEVGAQLSNLQLKTAVQLLAAINRMGETAMEQINTALKIIHAGGEAHLVLSGARGSRKVEVAYYSSSPIPTG